LDWFGCLFGLNHGDETMLGVLRKAAGIFSGKLQVFFQENCWYFFRKAVGIFLGKLLVFFRKTAGIFSGKLSFYNLLVLGRTYI
jgi:hypothetical protein